VRITQREQSVVDRLERGLNVTAFSKGLSYDGLYDS
jgi:hypothetical protein